MQSGTFLFLAAPILLLAPGEAGAVPLAPHRASYDLTLQGEAEGLVNVDGRIAIEMREDKCEAYKLDYRFVARFQKDQELIVTDQQTRTRESLDGQSFSFETKSFVDAQENGMVSGSATTKDGQTEVTFTQPEARTLVLPKSLFPMQHTSEIIERAKKGERIAEFSVFDGDADAGKLLTSTAVIAPVDADGAPAKDVPAKDDGSTGADAAGTGGFEGSPSAPTPEEGTVGPAPGDATADEPQDSAAAAQGPEAKLKGLKSWRVSESYYNSDSDPDGLPIFQTRYTLYENGVSDDLLLKFDGYALAGGLSSLDLLPRPDCP
ncbi:EipB family protein [Aurantimonas sp. VKM B-3413]|uniref:EipB family protein n=1 Tax=Aurantimonas sp. VKM B-3413 TaxID=2779401 RepID=UPI001E62FA75|nr:DUF1849 family protein [Aurantimonas sp. VKM B-3413]MCB8840432.1 cell envelope integrity EipB family protein [Aurantimonas sp. VKM B-3413]